MSDFDSRPIVVGVDGSPASRAALRWAVQEADRRGCPVDAVLAWQGGYGMMIGAVPADVMFQMAPEQDRDSWHHVLDDAVAEVSARGEVRTLLVSQDAGPALVEASENAALLVVGSRGAGSLRGALLGSVSAYCLRHASCPVVVLRDPDRRQETPPGVAGTGVLVTPGPLL
jgi:nucleotide-binding universal stress UspA family protein